MSWSIQSLLFPLFLATALTDLDTPTINKLLTALNECTEWGQVFILDSLATYTPTDAQEAQNICERVTPRLSHANAAVVLSAVKVLMKFMEALPSDSDYLDQVTKKLAPPLGEQANYIVAKSQTPFLSSQLCRAVFLVCFSFFFGLLNRVRLFAIFFPFSDSVVWGARDPVCCLEKHQPYCSKEVSEEWNVRNRGCIKKFKDNLLCDRGKKSL